MNEVITSELKAKVIALFEQSDKLIEEQAEFIEELKRRLKLAENVCYEANLHLRGKFYPLMAIGDLRLKEALKAWILRRNEPKGEGK